MRMLIAHIYTAILVSLLNCDRKQVCQSLRKSERGHVWHVRDVLLTIQGIYVYSANLVKHTLKGKPVCAWDFLCSIHTFT